VLHVADHRDSRVGEDFARAKERLPWRYRQEVGPERVDLGQEGCLRGRGHTDDGDHRADPDRDPERGQARP
jgi:hypothetical protein